MTTDLVPFAGTVGSGFFIGLITGYAIKKVIKLAAVIVGLFIAALAYLEYQRILNVDWHKVQSMTPVFDQKCLKGQLLDPSGSMKALS